MDICITVHTDAWNLSDRRIGRKYFDATMNKHNAFGHGNFSFNPVATYTKIIYLVPTLPQSVKFFVSYSAKLELQKQYNV